MKTCLVCEKEIPGVNGKYCSRACYTSTMTNTVKKRHLILRGKKVSFSEATKALNTNAYSLARMVMDDSNAEVQPYPSREEYIKESLATIYKNFPNAPTKEEIIVAKETRGSLKVLAKKHGITQTTISNLCLLHEIDSTFHQVDPQTKEELENIHDLFRQHKSAERIAKVIGVSPSLVLQKAHAAGVEIKPSFTSVGEDEVFLFIESLGFRPTKRKTNQYEIDIFIPEKNLGIEFNGVYWHSKYKPNYHVDKYRKARQDGIRLIQIWDLDWQNKQELIKRKLRNLLGLQTTAVGARSLKLYHASIDDVRDFYESNHIQGAKPAKYHLTLMDGSTIKAALSFSVSDKEAKIERFATDGVVSGGFERLFKEAKKVAQVSIWKTFVDLMWSDEENNQYCRHGFFRSHISRPNYFWIKNGVMYSRMNFQKHKLTKFPNYDPSLSESQIMKGAGYFRVYDCGNAVLYLKQNPTN